MAQLLQLRLNRHDAQPWGFRLQGGKDFGTPLVVQKVNGGSIAEQAGLIPGDAVIQINNAEVFNLRHKDAQDIIVRSGNVFDITIQRGGSTWRPQITPVGSLPSPASRGNTLPTVTKTSLAHRPQEVHHIGSGYNNSARPFSSLNGSDGQVKSIVNKQYNTPVGIYSEEAIAETLSAQAEVLAGGVLGVNFKKNEKAYSSEGSEVYKFLQEQDDDPREPDPPAPANFFWTASHAIGGRRSPGQRTPTSVPQSKEDECVGTALQPNTLSPGALHRPSLPTPKTIAQPTAAVSTPDDSTTKTESAAPPTKTTSGSGVPTCGDCGVSIVGVFVRVKDKNLHVDCFKCATCGTSLKNQGYYNFNNKLYCDIHAKLAALNNPPCGTEGYVPVPIKPNTKLSANVINAAMNAAQHQYNQSNGTSHLITSPTSNTDAAGSVVSLPFQPSHSRTSSSSSSVGTSNSCISSLSPNISSTPEKLSPVHSRQSSGSGTLVGGGAGGSPNLQQLQLKASSAPPPTTFCTMSNNETTINHKQNENDMNSNNRNTSNGTTGEGGYGAPQTSAYNQFLKEYSNKKSNETTDGGYKSFPADTNGSRNNINMTFGVGASSNGHTEGSTAESLYGTIRHDTKIQPNEDFQYVTLDGSVIKSVIPPGKGVQTNYKVHQGYGGPKPFNVSPKTPPIGGPRSPATYPPSQTANWGQPKQATNPYATLPRTTGSSQDDHPDQQQEDHSHIHPRPFTPSIINKGAPHVPFYQTDDQLVFEECSAKSSQLFERRSVSPCIERARSPAPGPPPNPLNAIRAPQLKEEQIVPIRSSQVGSITTGQPCLGAQFMQQQQQQQQQGKLLSHYETMSQSGSQSFDDRPEVVQEKRIGDTQIQTREKESAMNEEQRSQLEAKTTTQIGNTQIERRRKVVEEYEHTQKAKTVEIRKTAGETHQFGRTGLVANQTSRLSGLEKEISSLTSQSKAISARAASLGQQDTKFPQYTSPEPESKFPIKNFLPSYDESQKQSSIISGNSAQQLLTQPSTYQDGQEKSSSTTASSSFAASSVSQLSTAQSFLANSNQSSASNFTTAIPVPAFKPPMPPAGGSSNSYDKSAQQMQQPSSNNNTYKPTGSSGPAGFKPPPPPQPSNINPSANISDPSPASTGPNKGGVFGATSAPKRGRGILNKAVGPGARVPLCGCCNCQVRGPFITALGRIWCPEHFVCVNGNCRRPLQDIGFVEEKGDLYCEYCFEKYLAPTCSKCNIKIKGDCLNAIGKHFHPECFTCTYCGKLFGNSPFFLEEGEAYCEADWNELFTTKCFACGFPVEAGDRWVEALNHNYHSQCFNCTMCKKNLEGQSFYNKGGRPFCKNHAR